VDDQRKYAYRYLLYWAALETRALQWLGPRGWQAWTPMYWREALRRVRYAGGVADWLHNLALYSATDFRGFDEGLFWRDFVALRSRHPGFGWDHYREQFERHARPSEPGA
jgi:hypothetical protein